MIIPYEDSNGNLKLDPGNMTYIVFCSGGIISNFMAINLYNKYIQLENEEDPFFNFVISKERLENVLSAKAEINYIKSKGLLTKYKITIIDADFNEINEWLPRFIRDYYEEFMFERIKIFFGLDRVAIQNNNKIITNDEKINAMIEYPFANFHYHDILGKIIISDYNIITRSILCENPKPDKKYCGKCASCKTFEKGLLLLYSEQYTNKVMNAKVSKLYKEVFGKPIKYMQAAYSEHGPFLIDVQKETTPKIKPMSNKKRAKDKEE